MEIGASSKAAAITDGSTSRFKHWVLRRVTNPTVKWSWAYCRCLRTSVHLFICSGSDSPGTATLSLQRWVPAQMRQAVRSKRDHAPLDRWICEHAVKLPGRSFPQAVHGSGEAAGHGAQPNTNMHALQKERKMEPEKNLHPLVRGWVRLSESVNFQEKWGTCSTFCSQQNIRPWIVKRTKWLVLTGPDN